MIPARDRAVTRALAPLTLLALLPLTASCGGGHTLTILTADSLKPAAEALAHQFEADHDNDDVVITTGDSATLAQQATDGDQADLLLTADSPSMASASSVLDGDPRVLGTDHFVMVSAAGAAPVSYSDVAAGTTTFAVCSEVVACGEAWSTLSSQKPKVTATPASSSGSASTVIKAVLDGTAGVGFVYASEAAAAGDDLTVTELPEASIVDRRPVIGVLKQSGDPDLATAFADFVTSDDGVGILADAGVQQ